MPAGGLVIAGVATIGGAVIGALSGAADREAAKWAQAEALAEIARIGASPDQSKEILLEKYAQVGILTPKLEQLINLESSKVSGIKEAPELRQAQMKALTALEERGKVGLTSEERASLSRIRREADRMSEAKRKQVLQSFQARGIAGGGAELASQLQAAQSGAEQASQESEQLGALASKRALESITGAGELGGRIRGQEFDIEKAKASAADEVSKFNVSQSIDRQMRNINREMDIAEKNLSAAQAIANANVGQANQEKYRQAQAAVDHWQRQLSLAQTKANAKLGQASQLNVSAAATGKQWADIGSGIGQVASAYGAQQHETNLAKIKAGTAAPASATSRAVQSTTFSPAPPPAANPVSATSYFKLPAKGTKRNPDDDFEPV